MITKIGNFLRKYRHKLIIFFAVLGPGFITAVSDNDAGGVATYSVAASLYGMASLFLIIPQTMLLAITQEIGARIAIVTHKGLGDLIRERFGVFISLLLFFFYFITNQGVMLQNVSGLKASLQLFNIHWQIGLIIICITLIMIVIKFNYKNLQKIFLFMILFYLAYVVSAWLAKPNWSEAINESFIFPKKTNLFDFKYWFSRIAVLGTTVTAWGQFFVHSYIIDKKLSIEHLKAEKIEVYLGSIVSNFFAWTMVVAVSYTLFINKIPVTDGFTAALAMRPLAGELATLLFSIGLFSASLLGLAIVPLATAYVFSEMFGFEGSLDSDFKKGRLFYLFFIVQIILALIITLFPQTSLFKLTLYADFLNGAMLPVIFYFLIKFSEDEEIMGKYVSRGFTSFFVRLGAVVITIAVVITFIGKILGI